jgi:hypothetical protein
LIITEFTESSWPFITFTISPFSTFIIFMEASAHPTATMLFVLSKLTE